jgi:hypothetical protein
MEIEDVKDIFKKTLLSLNLIQSGDLKDKRRRNNKINKFYITKQLIRSITIKHNESYKDMKSHVKRFNILIQMKRSK